ncbi:hypothetical protein DCC81_17940 [Chitinophaga parva]|uniref:Novel STAND NTPase 3 domain-containing protein n=1 Tax=Chitinophaga parva TaxID=2169414 RepID=A0A2T7BIK9_9BACT|nr:hypothetical protein [Chitinophaga parva]PUZ26120.1 hypothetical protein DCC81_17940 [Chitinophaga parva]
MINYNLHLLGWYAFQQLCLTICREILGQTVSQYLGSNDAGKDGAFTGEWKQQGREVLTGRFIIQCKFTSKQGANLSLSDISDEIEKAKKLKKSGRCDCYILLTNAGISGVFEELFVDAFRKNGIETAKIYGNDWICAQIHESKKLRSLVPRVYGLGDLSQILDERAYSQARQLLISMREDLAKIVITSTYHNAARAMDEHGFVLIIGEPAAGKTTIASLLAMAALDQWKLMTIKIERPEQITKHWNPDDPAQFFWIDDAFGVTQYESELVYGWNRILPQVKSMLKQGVKIVMTSRDYIYRSARKDLKEGAFPLFNESQVVIDLHTLTILERQQILYNHLKLGSQNKTFLTQIKPYLPGVADNRRFIPETARRLSDPIFTKTISLDPYSLSEFVEKQESFLTDTIGGLDMHCKAALALIYMRNGFLNSPIKIDEQELSAVERLGSNIGDIITAVDALRDSLLQFVNIDDKSGWRFKHPTIGDAFAKIISNSPEMLEIYLQGTPIEKIFEQVTCGNMKLEKAIVIPINLFETVSAKMLKFNDSSTYKTAFLSKWAAERKLHNFLARRCTPSFLKFHSKQDPQIFDRITKPSLSFDYSEEINLVIKLHREKLLPENYRLIFIEHISYFTNKGDDLTALTDKNLQSVFTRRELKELRASLRTEITPNLSNLLTEEIANFGRQNSETAEEYMENLLERYNILLDEFSEEPKLQKLVTKQIETAKKWIEDNDCSEFSSKPDRKLDTSNETRTFNVIRTIFDDIDSH